VLYFVLIDRFANGDPTNDGIVDPKDPQAFHGGDLQGVIDHLGDLRDLGVETLWLSPVFRMRTTPFFGFGAFHGYWVEDLTEVEPRFGTTDTLRRLLDEAHRRGMRVLLDMVYNHVAPDGELTRTHPDWFHDAPSIQHWDDPVERVVGQVHGLPDLAQEREPVYEYLRDASLAWIDRVHPDGYRIDAVRHMPASFLARLGADLRRRSPGLTLLGELFDGSPRAVSETAREAGLDAMFDFPLHFAMVDVFCHDASPGALGAVLSQDAAYPPGEKLVTFLDNHDLPRIRTACGNDSTRVERAFTFQLAARGVPALTYGTEAGLIGEKEPENRGDMRFGETSLRAHIRDRMAVRRAHPALDHGVDRPLLLDDTLYAFARTAPDETMIVAVNTGPGTRRVAGHDVPPGVAVFPGRAPPPAHAVVTRLSAKAPLQPGDTLLAVGMGDRFGNWEPTHGIPLPAQLELDPAVYAFKLVIRHADGSVAWEAGPNRYLLPGTRTAPLAWR
jgi:glycosidase